MTDTKRPVHICLRLDNGDTIEAKLGDPERSARFVGFRQRIEQGQLSTEEQNKQLEEIARIYQRLSEPVASQKKKSGPTVMRVVDVRNDLSVCPCV
jgi:hypothetical protein